MNRKNQKPNGRGGKIEALPPELFEFLCSAETTAQIAARYGLSAAGLTMRAKRAGIPLRRRGRRQLAQPSVVQQQIIALSATMTYEEIGKLFGVSRQCIHQICKRWQGFLPEESQAAKGERKHHVISFRVTERAAEELRRGEWIGIGQSGSAATHS